MKKPTATPQAVLKILREVVEAGERCPTNDELAAELHERGFNGLPCRAQPAVLARQGHLKVEIFALNWRVIEIDGKRSQECPHTSRGRPYKIIEKEPQIDPAARQAALALP